MACRSKNGDSKKYVTVYIHLPSGVDPMPVADHIIEAKLAASVSIVPALSRVRASSSRGSRLETETLLIINSKRRHVNGMTKYVRGLVLRYTTMLNIIYVPVKSGNPLLNKWVPFSSAA